MATSREYLCAVSDTVSTLGQVSERGEGVGQHGAKHQGQEENPRHYRTYKYKKKLTINNAHSQENTK